MFLYLFDSWWGLNDVNKSFHKLIYIRKNVSSNENINPEVIWWMNKLLFQLIFWNSKSFSIYMPIYIKVGDINYKVIV